MKRKVNTIRTNIFKNCQKREPIKKSDIFRNLTVAFSISLFILQLKSSDPYKRIFKSFSSDYFYRDGFRIHTLLRSSNF